MVARRDTRSHVPAVRWRLLTCLRTHMLSPGAGPPFLNHAYPGRRSPPFLSFPFLSSVFRSPQALRTRSSLSHLCARLLMSPGAKDEELTLSPACARACSCPQALKDEELTPDALLALRAAGGGGGPPLCVAARLREPHTDGKGKRCVALLAWGPPPAASASPFAASPPPLALQAVAVRFPAGIMSPLCVTNPLLAGSGGGGGGSGNYEEWFEADAVTARLSFNPPPAGAPATGEGAEAGGGRGDPWRVDSYVNLRWRGKEGASLQWKKLSRCAADRVPCLLGPCCIVLCCG